MVMPKITLVILAFKSAKKLGIWLHTQLFSHVFIEKNLMESNLTNVEANKMVFPSDPFVRKFLVLLENSKSKYFSLI